ncbi:ankyrin repeat-containing domain protein [Mycena epipterygia]|nr:ankyrin repeat-containing domain protein [Mycena epipterygia]
MAEKQHATQNLHHEGTGNWFLNGGRFHEWKKNPGSLWIEGQSGAGKTVLSSTVIAQLFDNKAAVGTSAVAYFYFDFRNKQNQLVEIMLRSIILQLSAQSPNKYMTLDQQYNLSNGQTLPTYQNLLDILDKFRLAACLLIELSRRKLDRNPDSILANLPDQLFEIYDRFLESIHPNDLVLVKAALRWLVWSAEPLSLTELEDTLAFDFSDPHRHVFQPVQRDDCANRVCSLLEGLITVGRLNEWDETLVVILAHASVADYLKSPQFAARHNGQYAALNHLHRNTFDFFDESPNWQRDVPPPLKLCSEIGYMEGVNFLLENDAYEDDTVVAALCTASESGHANIIHLLLEKSVDVNAVDAELGTALQAASVKGHTETVRLLLEKGADVNTEGGRYGTALQAASYHRSPEIVRILLKEGADVNAAGGSYGSALQAASYHGSPEIVRILLKEGADVNAAGGYYGNAFQAASFHGSPEVVRILLENGADVNAEGGEYGNALQAGSYIGSLEVVQILLKEGADVNAAGGYYGSALQVASFGRNLEIVRLLVQNGADVNAAGGFYGNALQAASYTGSPEVVRLLVESGTDINATGGLFGSALQVASSQGKPEIVRILLERGADVNATGGLYGTALRAASWHGHTEIVQLLLENGADVNVSGDRNVGPLQAASRYNYTEIVHLLREHGAVGE